MSVTPEPQFEDMTSAVVHPACRQSPQKDGGCDQTVCVLSVVQYVWIAQVFNANFHLWDQSSIYQKSSVFYPSV